MNIGKFAFYGSHIISNVKKSKRKIIKPLKIEKIYVCSRRYKSNLEMICGF